MSSPSKSLTAVGLYAAVGASTRGVMDAGFQVSHVLTEGSSGVASHALNFPDVQAIDKQKSWPVSDLADEGVDLIYSQPLRHQCFVAGTLVTTTRGQIPIEQVRKGDLVMTYRNDRFQMVMDTMHRTWTGSTVRISSKFGVLAVCTPDHPFCTVYDGQPGQWTDARECDGLQIWNPTILGYTDPLRVEIMPPTGAITVYNLQVDVDQCYVVAGLLAHNCDIASNSAQILRPRAFMMEANADLFASPQFDRYQSTWEDAGYRSCRVLVNAAALGLPQLRRRAFFVAAEANLDFEAKSMLPRASTVLEAIGDLMVQPKMEDPQALNDYFGDAENEFQQWCRRGSKGVNWHVESPGAPSIASLIPHIPAGQHVGKIPDEIYEQTYWKERHKSVTRGGRGKPSYYYRRLHWERACPSIPGDIRFVHPEFDRFITPRESARLMGIPDSFVFSGTSSTRANMEAGRSGSPYVFQALAAQIMACLQDPEGRKHRERVDISAVKIPRLQECAAA